MKKQTTQLIIAFFVPILIASLFRFWDIDLRPLHSDEGVNSFFLRNLFERNHYRYDPANYHGPFLYYIGLLPFYVLGLTDFSFRLMPVLFGIMVVAILYPLRKRIGKMGLLTAGLLIAISPSNSFFSRDTIHETYLIFFTLATVVSFFLYSETRKSRYIYFAASSIAFIITIKETYIITFAVFVISLFFAYGYEILLSPAGIRVKNTRHIFSVFGNTCRQKWYVISISVGLFLLINFLFYSSFFSYYGGINGILTTLKIWTKTGTHSGGHAKPFFYYFTLLRKFELPMLVMGIAGVFYSFKYRNKFAIFTTAWAALIYVIYSLIPYKTPWLIINFTLPIAILAGIFIDGLFKIITHSWHYAVFFSIYVCVFCFFCYQSIMLNFVNYDDERYELVYVQTKRDVYNLLDRLETLSGISGKNMVINVVSKDYWPLPWYFREYKHANFWGRVVDNPNAPVILVDKKGEKDLKKKLKGNYKNERFILRPGVWLTAYIQQGLYDSAFAHEIQEKKITPLTLNVSKDELEPGLKAQYYYNVDCIGQPFSSSIEKESISFTYNDETKKPYRSPFGIEWEGYLYIKQKGVYQFATKSDDGSFVYIDENLVVDNGEPHAVRYISGVTPLEEGYHAIRIQYFDIGGGAIMELLWKTPKGNEVLIPGDVLFHKKTNHP
ncbi:MAG: TIGR03663 family protein [Planctomycetes bacterium]|nr:TIGR03663 family protein [Planctomycetota bacterium]